MIFLYLLIAYVAALLLTQVATWVGRETAALRLRDAERARREREAPRGYMSSWIRNGLALIRSVNARDVADQLVSVQPMRSHGLARIHYLDLPRELPRRESLVLTDEESRLMSAMVAAMDMGTMVTNHEAKPRALRTSWNLQSTEDFLNDWGQDASLALLEQGLLMVQHEEHRAVRNHLIACAAVEESFAGWELRERYRAEDAENRVPGMVPHGH